MRRRRGGSGREVIFEQREEWPQLLTFVNRNNTAHNYILKLHRTFNSVTLFLNLKKKNVSMNTCRTPRLEMSSKRFTVATIWRYPLLREGGRFVWTREQVTSKDQNKSVKENTGTLIRSHREKEFGISTVRCLVTFEILSQSLSTRGMNVQNESGTRTCIYIAVSFLLRPKTAASFGGGGGGGDSQIDSDDLTLT